MRIITEESPKVHINISAHLELQQQVDEFLRRGGKIIECEPCKSTIEHISAKKDKDGNIINGFRDDREHSRRATEKMSKKKYIEKLKEDEHTKIVSRHAYSGHKYISKDGDRFRFMWERKFKSSGTLEECVKARNEFLKAKKLPIPD